MRSYTYGVEIPFSPPNWRTSQTVLRGDTHGICGKTDMRVRRRRRLLSPSNARGLVPLAALAIFVRQPQREVEGRLLSGKAFRLETRPRSRSGRLTRRGRCDGRGDTFRADQLIESREMALQVRFYLLFLPSIVPCPPKQVAGVVGHLSLCARSLFCAEHLLFPQTLGDARGRRPCCANSGVGGAARVRLFSLLHILFRQRAAPPAGVNAGLQRGILLAAGLAVAEAVAERD